MTQSPEDTPSALLFAGHMIDLPGRPEPRFPPEMEEMAAEAISAAVQRFVARTDRRAVALSSAARGGDILFLEACRHLGIECFVVLPFPAEKFVKESVEGPKKGRWVARFWKQWNATPDDHREVLDETRDPDGPYAACNRRLIAIARSLGSTLHLIALWNGATGDGPGGTGFMVERVRESGGTIDRIDSNRLLELVG